MPGCRDDRRRALDDKVDKMIGGEFEKGLSSLRYCTERVFYFKSTTVDAGAGGPAQPVT